MGARTAGAAAEEGADPDSGVEEDLIDNNETRGALVRLVTPILPSRTTLFTFRIVSFPEGS